MKYLTVILVILLLISANFLYNQYTEVDRFQKKELQIRAEKLDILLEQPKFKSQPKTYASGKDDMILRQHIPVPEGYAVDKSIKLKPNLVSDDCPEWVKQSPFWIAIGLWLEMFKNLVTLLLSFVTALFMYLMYKKDKGEEVEVEVVE